MSTSCGKTVERAVELHGTRQLLYTTYYIPQPVSEARAAMPDPEPPRHPVIEDETGEQGGESMVPTVAEAAPVIPPVVSPVVTPARSPAGPATCIARGRPRREGRPPTRLGDYVL